MIQAYIFDLDGTLVQTERLKAISYAKAAEELRPEIEQEAVVSAFKKVVGKTRREVASYLLDQFELQEPAEGRMDEFGVTSPWQAYVQVRLNYYHHMIEDPDILREHRWPHTQQLLEQARQQNCTIALATMSRCEQAHKVLEALDLEGVFRFIATRDDVEHGKPDPEIYRLVAEELSIDPKGCLVIEDSPSGVKAALAAGMNVVAIATPFTGQLLRELEELPGSHIAEGPDDMSQVVEHVTSHIQ